MSFKGPLADRYSGAVFLVLLTLTPFLILTSATFALNEEIGKAVHLSPAGLEMTTGMANAAYCFGTVLSIQLATRLHPRRLLLLYAALFTIASVLAAWAPTPGLFVAGHVLQGLATALMLIVAAPPLITGHPAGKLRFSAIFLNLGIFGAVALGPVIGGYFANWENWELLFWIISGLGLAAFLVAILTFEDQPPEDPEAPIDVLSVVLAAAGTGIAFFGVSELASHGFMEWVVLAPLLTGTGILIVLLVHQFFADDPLIPVEKLAHTVPVAAIVIAMAAGAASVALVDLVQSALELRKFAPEHVATLFWPEFGGAILTAALLGAIFFTRWVPALAFSGLVILAGAGVELTGAATGSDILILVGAGGIGLGVGASVSPALFTTGFSLRATMLPRVFAIVELLRGFAAFLVGPILLHLSETVGATPAAGVESGIWVAVAIAVGGALLAMVVFVWGGARLQRPDLEKWLEGEKPAIESPQLSLRPQSKAPADAAGRA